MVFSICVYQATLEAFEQKKEISIRTLYNARMPSHSQASPLDFLELLK